MGSIIVSDLDAFKDSLSKADLYEAATVTEKASHTDETLLRFLRARQGNVAAAQKQFSDTEAWRKKHDVDNLFRTFPEDEYFASKRYYPRWTGRRDKGGHPLYVYHIASVGPLSDEIHAVAGARRYQRIIALYEYLTNFVLPFCDHVRPSSDSEFILSCTTIIDLSGFSLSTAFSLRNHLQEASRLATANYPETLHRIAVVNAPSFFPTIWGWIKGWFDEGTREKIYILGKDMEQLKEIAHEKDLPKKYGGTLAWEYHDEPTLDDALQSALGEAGFPKAPAVFADGHVKSATE